MPYIKDKELFKAVSFASSMKKNGKPIGLACKIAADYYGVSQSDVASELGKRGKSVAQSNKVKNGTGRHDS